MSEPDADAALRSRGALRRFAAAYRGPHPPADALWWLAHPFDPAPSGSPSPRRALVALQAALAGPNVDAGLRERHATALARIDEDEQAARAALAAATRPSRRLPAVAAAAGAGLAAAVAVPLLAPPAPAPPAGAEPLAAQAAFAHVRSDAAAMADVRTLQQLPRRDGAAATGPTTLPAPFLTAAGRGLRLGVV